MRKTQWRNARRTKHIPPALPVALPPLQSLHALTGWRGTPGTALAMPPLLSLMSGAGAQPARGPPAPLGLSILLLRALPVLLPSSPSHPWLHLFGSPWGPAVSQGGNLGQEGCVSGAQAHPPHLQHPGMNPQDVAGPAELHGGSFHLLPSPVHGEANMAIFIPAKCSCSCRQVRDALPGWGEEGKLGGLVGTTG